MAEKHYLNCQKRELVGRKVKRLRLGGTVPANVFGNKITSLDIQVNTKEFAAFYAKVGESSLAYLHIDSEKDPRPVFVSQVSRDPVTSDVLHVAFHQVDLKQKVTAPVQIVLVGESLAEKDKLGIMVQQLHEVEIEALPADMPENIQVDVSSLAEVGSHITVGDLSLDTTRLKIVTSPENTIVQIEALAKEEIVPSVTPAEGEVAPIEDGAPEKNTEQTKEAEKPE